MSIKKDQSTESAINKAFTEAKEDIGQGQGTEHAQAQAGAQTGPRTASGSLGTYRSQNRRAMRRSVSGEAINGIMKALRAVHAAENTDGSLEALRFTPIVSDDLPYNIIVVHMGFEDTVAATSLIIEGSNPNGLGTHSVNIGQQHTVDVELTAGDLRSDYLWDHVQDAIASSYPAGTKIIEGGTFPVPAEVSAEDEGRMHGVLFDAYTANFTILDRVLGGIEDKFNVGLMTNGQEETVVKIEFGSSQSETPTGDLVRSDIVIATKSQERNQNNQQQQLPWGNKQITLAELTGYVDLVYTQPNIQTDFMGNPIAQAMGQAPQMQCYFPRFNITNISHAMDTVSMGLQLFALGTSRVLAENQLWAKTFIPRYDATGDKDLRDIGAIQYEAPALRDVEVDTKSTDFQQKNLLPRLIESSIHPDLIYGMDILEAGALNCVQDAFVSAAQGNVDAQNYILNEANFLTNGKFQELYNGEEIFAGEVDRIFVGYYVDGQGNRRDLRDIDNLAMLNLVGKDDLKAVEEYDQTFVDFSAPVEVRLQRRLRMLRGLLGESNVFLKGYARRLTFNAAFIDLLARAMKAAGLNIRPEGAVTGIGAGGRATANWAQYAQKSGQQSNLFQNSFGGNRGNQGGFGNNMRTSW